jgi:hypothetical protein
LALSSPHSIPMPEPKELVDARTHLALGEKTLRTEESVFHFEEGLALLQDVVATGAQQDQRLATNIANTYATKIYGIIGGLLEQDRNMPEPDLEHLFRLLLVFDEGGFELPPGSRTVKIRIGHDLLNRYLEGHASEEKQAALRDLMKLAEGGSE